MNADDMRQVQPRTWLRSIASEVASETGVAIREILSYRRYPEIVRARHEVIYRASDRGMSGAEISRAMGLDYSTVLGVLRKSASPVFRSVRA